MSEIWHQSLNQPQAFNEVKIMIHCSLAKNKNTPKDIFKLLGELGNLEIDRLCAANESVPVSLLLRYLESNDSELRRAALRNPSMPVSLLKEKARSEPDHDTRMVLIANPAFPSESFSDLAKGMMDASSILTENQAFLLEAMSNHENISIEFAESLMAYLIDKDRGDTGTAKDSILDNLTSIESMPMETLKHLYEQSKKQDHPRKWMRLLQGSDKNFQVRPSTRAMQKALSFDLLDVLASPRPEKPRSIVSGLVAGVFGFPRHMSVVDDIDFGF